MHIAVVDARLAIRDVAARFIHKTAYQTALTFRLLLLTNEQRAKAWPTLHGLHWRSGQFRADDREYCCNF